MKREVCDRKVESRDELLSLILDSAVCIKNREDHLRLTTRDLCTRVPKCIEVDGGIFQHFFFWTVTKFDI
jgi:hypothetical protein